MRDFGGLTGHGSGVAMVLRTFARPGKKTASIGDHLT